MSGVDSTRPVGPHSQLQKIAATTASGDGPERWLYSSGSAIFPATTSTTMNRITV